MQLDIIETGDRLTRLALCGRLDTESVNQIEARFTALTVSGQKHAVVDVSDVPYLASMGIRMLVAVAKAMRRHNYKLVLLAPQPLVLDVLRMAGMDTIVDVAQDDSQVQRLLAGAA